MAKEIQDLSGLVVGPLKIVEATEERDSSKRVIWKAECICGEIVCAAKTDLERYAGYDCCLGHPPKGQPTRIIEFKLHPDLKGTEEQANALQEWDLKRNAGQEPDQSEDQTPVLEPDTAPSLEADSEAAEEAVDSSPITKASSVLEKRLGLTGYRTEAVSMPNPVSVLGSMVEKVVFARKIDGDDRVLLHLLVVAGEKRTIMSSMKKVPIAEMSLVSDALAGMQIAWRMKESRRKAKV